MSNQQKDDNFRNLNVVCGLVEQNLVIPIIGYDLFDAVFESQSTDVLKLLASEYDSAFCEKTIQSNPKITGLDLINSLYHSLNINQKSNFGTDISDIITRIRNDIDPVPECFEQLARIKGFRFYINATIFNSLELAISTFRAPKSSTPEEKNYDVKRYHPRFPEDIEYDTTQEYSTENFAKPSIYNWLGTHDKNRGEYVLADVDYIELLVKMITNENKKFSNLQIALKDANLLFIGCDFPDWILRFFLRFCYGSKMREKEKVARNQIVERLTGETDYNKSFLIGNFGITTFHLKPDIFIKQLFKELEKRDKSNIENSFFNNRVFISYNHEDAEIAKKIYEQLKDAFIDTWFDSRLRQGDELDKDIIEAIDNACALLPIVTNNVNTANQKEKYYKKEWNYAVSRKSKQEIFPIHSADFNSHTLRDDSLEKQTVSLIISNKDTEYFIKKEIISAPDFVLSDEFLRKLKQMQYEHRISQR